LILCLHWLQEASVYNCNSTATSFGFFSSAKMGDKAQPEQEVFTSADRIRQLNEVDKVTSA
jgi:hypothetical protein